MEKLIIGLQITFIGMTVVFFILILIKLALDLMRVLFYKPVQSSKAPGAMTASVAPLDPDANQDPGHLIALLTAAILATGETTAPFRTLSIRSVTGKGSTWKENARTSLMAGMASSRSRQKHSFR
ncbi:MAG: OadG family protein [Desulfobacterales bacterium]|nr:OadG family protein [Desulfobacterales bacterium]